ncbi:hypothetical protein BKA80DRAFT_325144 [Phyllosticta citrichinensis]
MTRSERKKQRTKRLRNVKKDWQVESQKQRDRRTYDSRNTITPNRAHQHSPLRPAYTLITFQVDPNSPLLMEGTRVKSSQAEPDEVKPSHIFPSAPPIPPTLSRTLTPPNETRLPTT